MYVTIQNMTDQRILLRFNSSQTQHLAPHETVANVAATEIKSNTKIEKLIKRRVIAITRPKESEGVSAAVHTEESRGTERSRPRKSAAKNSGSD